MNYHEIFERCVDISKLKPTAFERISPSVKKMIDGNDFVIDVHTHLFDIKCINKSYFLLRQILEFVGIEKLYDIPKNIKDDILYKKSDDIELIGIKKFNDISKNMEDDRLYEKCDEYDENWEEELIVVDENINNIINKKFIDNIKFSKFLRFKTLRQVYENYIHNYSLAEDFRLNKENVIITALMMDLEIGWNTKIGKGIIDQIDEINKFAANKPILPFLVVDPRRVTKYSTDEKLHLYRLFNKAFCEADSLYFGIKVYPSLGFDPSDARLDPIFKICEDFKIPVLTHCGGETISIKGTQVEVYKGNEKVIITADSRKSLAYKLNDPELWRPILDKYPTLKLNIAHFGDADAWKPIDEREHGYKNQDRLNTIIDLMDKFPNVYSDLSFIFQHKELHNKYIQLLLKNSTIKNKTLFGTDYWVVNPKINLKYKQSEFIESLNKIEPNLKFDLAKHNTMNYLFN